jgi:hypothetical protein
MKRPGFFQNNACALRGIWPTDLTAFDNKI